MSETLTQRLARAPVVPLVQTDDAAVASAIAEALIAGGLGVIEVVLRTDKAMAILKHLARSVPAAAVGAGTVLTADQAREAVDAGAAFIVSPGLEPGVVRVAQEAGLPVFPGIATATELQQAWNLGLREVKFFPAGLAGGTAMLKALAAVFRGVRFMPTGGISAANLAEYLVLPEVLACGGSWLTPASAIAVDDYAAVTRLASEALLIASVVRKSV